MPDQFAGAPPRLEINRYAKEPDPELLRPDGWEDGQFQGQPALVRDKKLPHAYTRGAIFERSGQWFEVAEGLSVAASAQKDDWWQYLETFRYPDGIVPAPAATPATAPARGIPTSGPSSAEPFKFPNIIP